MEISLNLSDAKRKFSSSKRMINALTVAGKQE